MFFLSVLTVSETVLHSYTPRKVQSDTIGIDKE